ncbi:MAG: LrgB family protein [Marinilabiliaceae bacterium]|nr:LrgB family protein [Marinilabiliaceae bacterium]
MEIINSLYNSPFLIISLTLGVYLASTWLYKKIKLGLLHPVLVSVTIIILFLKLTDIPYNTYKKGSYIFDILLDLSVVALGFILFEQINSIKKYLISIFTSVFVGSIIGIISVIGLLKIMDVPEIIISSITPKSVTNPIAIRISEITGGLPPITAIVVIFTGIFGSIIGPYLLKYLKIKSKIAKGLAMGSSAHGIGTARAIEMGAVEGAISGLAIGIMGFFTATLIPFFQWLLS